MNPLHTYTPLVICPQSDPRLAISVCQKCGKSTDSPAYWNAHVTLGQTLTHICDQDERWNQVINRKLGYVNYVGHEVTGYYDGPYPDPTWVYIRTDDGQRVPVALSRLHIV